MPAPPASSIDYSHLHCFAPHAACDMPFLYTVPVVTCMACYWVVGDSVDWRAVVGGGDGVRMIMVNGAFTTCQYHPHSCIVVVNGVSLGRW